MAERRRLRSLWYMTSLAFRADPWRASAALITSAVNATGAAMTAFTASRLVQSVLQHDRERAISFAIATAIVGLISVVASLVRLDLRFHMEEAVTLLIDGELIALTTGVSGLELYERPEHLDRLELVRQQREALGGSVGALIENVGIFTSIMSVTGLLAAIDARLLLLPLFGLPSIATAAWEQRRLRRVEEETAEPRRLARHLFELATTGPPAKELRVFGLRDELRSRHDTLLADTDDRFNRLAIRTLLVTSSGWLMFAVGYAGALLFVLHEVVSGRATAADVVLAVTLAAQVNQQVSAVFMMVQWMVETLKTVGRYLRLGDDARAGSRPPERPAQPPARLEHGIDFDHVTFRYPGTEVDILRNVNLHIPAGATVAVVGDNGAGKSTLVKLLCSFYTPTEGRVVVDGIDLHNISVAEWRERMAAGFQDFARLELLARETVGVGDLPLIDDPVVVRAALERASGDDVVDTLPRGLDSQVGRKFDGGVELSGGQWQKLALGRAMMRERPLLLVLDEPTASLDADTEHALFARYAGAAQSIAQETGGITVLVSHRFSTVRMADLIVVVRDGGVEEIGSHHDLMARAGTYAELYELQARAYR